MVLNNKYSENVVIATSSYIFFNYSVQEVAIFSPLKIYSFHWSLYYYNEIERAGNLESESAYYIKNGTTMGQVPLSL